MGAFSAFRCVTFLGNINFFKLKTFYMDLSNNNVDKTGIIKNYKNVQYKSKC